MLKSSGLSYYTKIKGIIAFPRKDLYKTGLLVLFGNTIQHIVTAPQIRDMGGEEAEVEVLAANEPRICVVDLEPARASRGRSETASDKFRSSGFERTDVLESLSM